MKTYPIPVSYSHICSRFNECGNNFWIATSNSFEQNIFAIGVQDIWIQAHFCKCC